MFKLKKKNNKRGFTLIELIVVIAILGILAAILVPTMLGVVGDANEKVDKANVQTLYNAAQAAYVKLTSNGTTIDNTNHTDQDSTTDTEGNLTFIGEVKANLSSGFKGTYEIKTSANGVESVKYTNKGVTWTYDGADYVKE